MESHATDECRGCEWERFPQAFRWFPEMGPPWTPPAAPRDRPVIPAATADAAAGLRIRPD